METGTRDNDTLDHYWADELTRYVKIGDRIRIYSSSDTESYVGAQTLGTVIGFRRDTSTSIGSLTGDYFYDPVVVTDDLWHQDTFVTRYWAALDGRSPEPFRDTAASVAGAWVRPADQTPNPAHHALVQAALERGEPKQIDFRRPSLRHWLNNCCQPDPDGFAPKAHLFASWNVWAEVHHGPFMPERWLLHDLESLGFRRGQRDELEGVFGLSFQADVAKWVAEEADRQAEREAQRAAERATHAERRQDNNFVGGGSLIFALAGLAVVGLLVVAVVKWAWQMVFG